MRLAGRTLTDVCHQPLQDATRGLGVQQQDWNAVFNAKVAATAGADKFIADLRESAVLWARAREQLCNCVNGILLCVVSHGSPRVLRQRFP